MNRLWVRLMKHHRIWKQQTMACEWGEEQDVLVEICREFDIPAPMWLNKHVFEFEQFRHTAFTKEHFVEDISFDKMEIEFIDGVARKSSDIRNQFD